MMNPKKMQRNVLKHQFENFITAPNESLDKAYDRFQKLISQLEVHAASVSKEDINKSFLRSLPPSWSQIALIMRNKPDIDQTDIDDLYNNLRVYEDEMKRSLSSTSNSQNLAFLSSENTSSTNEVSTASGNFGVNTARGTSSTNQVSSTPGADEVVCSFFAQQTTSPPLDNEDLQQIDQDDLEELDIRWQVAMLTVRGENATTNEPSSQALVAQDRLGGYDRSNDFDELVNYALMAISSSSSSSSSDNKGLNKLLNSQMSAKDKNGLGYGTQLDEISNKSHTNSEISMSVFEVRSSDEEITPANDRFSKADGYHVVPPPITGNFLTPRADISFAGLDEYAIRKKIIESKTTELNTDTSKSKTSETIGKTNEVNIKKPKSFHESVVLKPKFNIDKVIIEDWNSDDEDDVSEVNTVNLSDNEDSNLLLGLFDFDSPVSLLGLFALKTANGSELGQFIQEWTMYEPEPYIHQSRGLTNKDRLLTKDLKTDVKTCGIINIQLLGQGAVDNTWYGVMMDNALKCQDRAIQRSIMKITIEALWLLEVIPKEVKLSGKGKIKTANLDFDDVYFVDELKFNLFSVSQMCDKKNNVLFTDTECLILSPSFKLLDENQVVLRVLDRNDVYSLDLKNIVPSGDPLGKFDRKSDEGYLLGYSTTSKAFRVYNKRTKRVEENMHIDFLKDQLNVAGSGPDWMFDLDFLTNTMNYIPVSVENQVNVDAGTQEHYVAGSSEKDKEPTQEYILLPLHPHGPMISVEDVVQAAQDKPSENFPKYNDVHDSEDVTEKEEQHIQAFEEEKKRAAQATSINKLNTGRPSVSTSNSPLVSIANTLYASAASTPTGANTGGSSFVYLGGQIPIDASTLPNVDLPIDPNMPDLEDDSNVFPNDGIFSGAYDDEDVGAEADFNNMDNTIDVSLIPTLRVHKDHPKGQILGDPKSAVQTRGKIQKASSVQQALVSYIYNQNRTNHKDHQNCLFACFLSQEEPKNISQALQDESWVEAIQEELLQFKLQKVWILVDLPYRKKAIGTKWVFKNKRDVRSFFVKNKARLVVQGFRQEEGIDYDEVFAP
ncbi:putative ribonuclease H-like domain-containing protein, partial [Tanacetum coccineum]